MPIYEYLCNKCKKPFEHLALNNEQPACPVCASKKLTRLMSASSIVTGRGAPLACGMDGGCSPDMCGGGRCGGMCEY